MTTFIECDWCSRPIDLDDEFEPDEYNRMGFEGASDCHSYVVMEARFPAARRGGIFEFGHFHNPDCWHAAQRLLRDHRRWAEAGDKGPEAALVPRWTKDGELKDTELAARRELGWTEKVQLANEPHGVGDLRISQQAWVALVRAGLVTVKQVLQCDALWAVPDIGPKRLQEIRRALERYELDREKGRK